MKIAVNRRTIILAAVAAAAVALAAGVFFASQKHERDRRRVEGLDPRIPAPPYVPGRELEAVRRTQPPHQAPVSDPAAVVREIERINRMNEELRRQRPVEQPKPTAIPSKPGARPKGEAAKPK